MTRHNHIASATLLALLATGLPGVSHAESQEAALPPADITGMSAQPGTPEADTLAIDFAPGSAWLETRAITALDYFTYYHVLKTPAQKLHLILHTDPTTDAPALTALRAREVEAYLESKGLPSSFLEIDAAQDPQAATADGEPRIEVFTR